MSANDTESIIKDVYVNVARKLVEELDTGNLGTYIIKLIKDESVNNRKNTTTYYIRWLFIFIYKIDMCTNYTTLKNKIDNLVN